MLFVFFFKQKTAYELRISDWSSDVCSSDLPPLDALVSAEATVGAANLPAHRGKRRRRPIRHTCFQPQHSARAEIGRILAHSLSRAFVVPARGIARRLGVEAVIDGVDDDLRLAPRLHVAAPHAASSEEHRVGKDVLVRGSHCGRCYSNK